MDLLSALQDAGVEVQHDVSARKLSTFAAGGMVRHLALPATISQLQACLRILPRTVHVLGGGSNTLVSDFGLEWVLCTRSLRGIEVSGTRIRAMAGEMLPNLSREAQAHGLSGLEFASGIPGTVGGALRMNAGAYGQDMAGSVVSTTLVTEAEVREADKASLALRYRDSRIVGVVAAVTFECAPKAPSAVLATMQDMQSARAAAQPHQPSLGCVFKASGGVSAAKLIQGCGLKGTRIGQAAVSGVHCNFIVNMGGATSRDYLRLVDVVKSSVYDRYGVYLEEEFVHMHD